jgi:hypothetical protein
MSFVVLLIDASTLSIIAFHAHRINKCLVDRLEVLYECYRNPIIIGSE